MEKFLADYGLKWIGNDEEMQKKREDFKADAVKAELDHQAPQYRSNLPKEIDTAVLTRRIEELNFIAEKNKIVTNAYGMKELQEMAPVRIFFFKNGIIMKGFNFAPYYSKQAQSVLSDILDGYFPYDLKKDYPDGVPLEPVDLTDDMFTEDMLNDKSNPKFKMLEDLKKVGPKAMSKKEFLSQFPKQKIMAGGEIVPIREELEKRFQETGKIDVEKLNSSVPIEAPTHVELNPGKYTAE